MNTLEEDFVSQLMTLSTYDNVLFFMNKGRVYKLKGYGVPELSRQSKGTPVINAIGLEDDEVISTVITVRDLEDGNSFLVFAIKKGIVKRSALSNFSHINKNGKIAIGFKGDGELIAVCLTGGKRDILLGTAHVSLIRFPENSLRPLGHTAPGVRGISLRENDVVVGLDAAYAESEDEVPVVIEKGYGKRTPVSEYRLSSRGGKGIKIAKITERNSNVVCITTVSGREDLMVVTDDGIIIRLQAEGISQNGRATQGVRSMKLGDSQAVSTAAKVIDKTEDEAATETARQTGHASTQTTESASEQVIDDTTPGNASHTESDEDDERTKVRQDSMDRVNGDIENDSGQN